MKPLIYFSYGMTKSASTLAYRLLWLTLEDAGFPQPKLPASIVDEMHSVNFIGHLSDAQLSELWEIAEARNYPVVVKTHSSPDPGMIDMLNDGRAIGSATYRDPRDIALSMLDHGEKARRKGHWAFKEYVEIDDTLPSIRGQLTCLEKWLRLPNILPLRYEDVAFDKPTTIKTYMSQLGVSRRIAPIVKQTSKNKYIQFNKGIHNRYLTEMSNDDSQRIAVEFAPLIDIITNPPTTNPALSTTAILSRPATGQPT